MGINEEAVNSEEETPKCPKCGRPMVHIDMWHCSFCKLDMEEKEAWKDE